MWFPVFGYVCTKVTSAQNTESALDGKASQLSDRDGLLQAMTSR